MRSLLALAAVSAFSLFCASAAAAEHHVSQRSPRASDAGPGTEGQPWKTISKAAEVMQPGDVAVIHAGVYREHVRPARSGIASAPITYRAAPGEDVVLSGADVVTGWTPAPGGVWRKEPWSHRFPTHPNDAKHRLIGRCEQVIVDGRLMAQVDRLDKMPPGSFFADTDNKALYVRLAGDRDPNQAAVEASVRSACFGPGWGGKPRDYITVRGLTVRHAANMAQRGALFALGDHWTIEDCRVEWTNGTGISFRGDHAVLRRVRSSDNGQQGLGGGGRHFLLEEVALERNNLKGFDKDWEGGGMKIALARDGTVRRYTAAANNGVGLWFDIDVRDVTVEECLCLDNAVHGIFVEISGGFTVRNNLCAGNGTDDRWGSAGIAVGESDNTTVENNTCVLNPTGITLREVGPRRCRSIDGKQVSYQVHDVTVRRNVCALNRRYQIGLWWDNPFFGPHPTPSVASQGTPLDPARAKLRFDENLYWPEGKQQVALWGCPWRPRHAKYGELAAWQSERGQDQHSLVADPQFVAPSKGDWSLRPESPARKLGAGPVRPPVPIGR
jgi:parallel beta-helix repeat protein